MIVKKFSKTCFMFLLLITNCSLLISQSKLDVLILDAGHGGKDPGTIGISGVKEKDIVLPITLHLGNLIQQKFPLMKVIYTRSGDEFPALTDRTRIANENSGKLFISIHANFKKKEETLKNGFEIYMLSRERFGEAVQITIRENRKLNINRIGNDTLDSYIFSSLVQNGYGKLNEYLSSSIEINLLEKTQLESRGCYQAGFWVIVASSMPAVLVETGYLSDANDEKFLSSPQGQKIVAEALFHAFVSYKYLFEASN